MTTVVPEAALKCGFVNHPTSVHTSKTMMLKELSLLFGASDPSATRDDYRRLVLDENVLLKKTVSNRNEVFSRLSQEYGLRRELWVFRVLRDLWPIAVGEQPLLAMLCALARDPLLRLTASVVLPLSQGCPVTPKMLEEAITEALPDRYSPLVRQRIGENAISSWTQSGHLQGKLRKTRSKACTGPISVAYALLLGHLCGVESVALFDTFWAHVTDASHVELDALAFSCSQRGWIDYRRIGDVVEMGFTHLLEQ